VKIEGGEYLSVTEMLAVLCDGKPSEIESAKRLTYYQASEVIQAKRGEDGKVIISKKCNTLTDENRFYRMWRKRKCPEWRIKELWQEYLKRVKESKSKNG